MAIAVVALGHSHKFTPWDDPGWDKWCLAWDRRARNVSRWFEPHDLDYIESSQSGPWGGVEYIEWLSDPANFDAPLYMREEYWPHVTRYPIEDVVAFLGRDYLESSVAYAFALAMMEGTPLGLWGAHMSAQSEYAYQRPNMEWLLGMAKGMGIDVTLPPGVRLLAFNGGKPKPDFNGKKAVRYGQWTRESQ